MNDWLCQDCKSVNSSSAANCYRCWTPRKFAEAIDPATLPPGVTPEQAHEERKRRQRPAISDARSSRRRSWVVLACITMTVAFSALSLAFAGAKGGSLGIALAVLSGDWTTVGSLLAISLVGGILAFAAAIAWFAWFDRVLANVPPLAGKWPEVSRPMAVVWWLVPVIGQFKGTFIVGHVYELMAVARSPGLWLLGLWGITWIGGTMAPGVIGFVVGWLPLSLEESVHLQDLVSNLGQISYIAAGFFAAALILALEHARDVRAAGLADAAVVAPEVPLEQRLEGQTIGPAPRPSWPVPLTMSHPASSPWVDDMGAWPAPSDEPADMRLQSPPMWPPPQPQHAVPLAGTRAITNPDPFEAPATARRRMLDRGPIPFEPILLMAALVLVGVVAGITMAGIADPLGTLDRITGRGPASTTTPIPPSTAQPSDAPTGGPTPGAVVTGEPSHRAGTDPTTAPATPSTPPSSATSTPAATRAPADLVARRLIRIVTDEPYHGLADIDATYTDGSGDTTWKVRLGRAGDREWRLQEVRPSSGDPATIEQAILVSSVWERGARTDWVQRRKTDRDRPTAPLFDLSDAAQLSFVGRADEDGAPLYRFEWRAGDARVQQLIRALGAAEGMRIASGELLVTERGVPVRLDLSLVGEASGSGVAPSLRMSVSYSEVGSDIEIRSPREGPPLVVRR